MTADKTTHLSALVEQLRARIGVETPPVRLEIEKSTIQRYALATGETNPIYFDEETAARSRFGAIVAPPTFLSWFIKGIIPDQVFDLELGLPTALHTDDVVKAGEYVRAGDTITAVGLLSDVYIREGRNGPMLCQAGDVNLTNQRQQFVGMVRTVSVLF